MVGLMKLHVSLLPSLDSSLLVAFRTHLCFSRPAEWKPYVLYYFSNIFAVEFWSHKEEKKKTTLLLTSDFCISEAQEKWPDKTNFFQKTGPQKKW